MIEKICIDVMREEDLNEFIRTGKSQKAQSILEKLEQDRECYIVGIDIASRKSKDYSCMTYYKKNEEGNILFVESKIIN